MPRMRGSWRMTSSKVPCLPGSADWLRGNSSYQLAKRAPVRSASSGIYHNVHGGTFLSETQTGPYFKSGNFSTGFHTFGCWWTSSFIKFYIDGVETTGAASTTILPNVPLCALIDFQLGGVWPGPPDGSTPWPGALKAQYLRIYQ
jgi:beta-glucanase (GH16 family)